MNVLIVDDNAKIRGLLRGVLSDVAARIWECADGLAAIETYIEHRPDVVLMDIEMPTMDGLTATQKIRQHCSSAKIVVITSYDDSDLREAAFEAGACRYMTKQDISELPEILLSLMAA
jgi:CheY-like chemotaxis protein